MQVLHMRFSSMMQCKKQKSWNLNCFIWCCLFFSFPTITKSWLQKYCVIIFAKLLILIKFHRRTRILYFHLHFHDHHSFDLKVLHGFIVLFCWIKSQVSIFVFKFSILLIKVNSLIKTVPCFILFCLVSKKD